MDISDTLAPNSDQMDAVDLLGSPPRIFTITDVTRGSADQPVNVHLAEFPRVWRPGKSMRRVLAGLWGKDSAKWIGRQVELFCDDNVMFGGEKVGGVRISRMSDINGRQSVPLIIKRGKSAGYKVDPLPAMSQMDRLKAEWKSAAPERRAAIEAEVASLNTAQPTQAGAE